MVRLTVDDKNIEAREGMNLLEACLENGIYIPNLCHMKGLEDPPASCRLCFVEMEGKRVCSCTVSVREGMIVRTDTEAVRRLQRTALRLLLTVHETTCARCPSNRKCELQRMARFLGVRLRPRRFEHLRRDFGAVPAHPVLEFVQSRCVLCGKCVHVCRQRNGSSLITFIQRGFDTLIASYVEDDQQWLPCRNCLACMEVCPVSAILLKEIPAENASESQQEKNI
jgi:bidirectional [NiFe] hydrogenase diaphorase subunit